VRPLPPESAIRVGTVDVPPRVERERYFAELNYIELSALFAGPLKPSVLGKWGEVAPEDVIGLVAPFPLTHRKPPTGTKLWPHDASTGEFRDSPIARASLGPLSEAIAELHAHSVVFRSPEQFSPSAGNRDQLKRFFGEVAVFAAPIQRVWVPGGLWNVRTALKLANELGVTCAFDPMVREPGEPPEVHYDLEAESLYLRIETPGRSGPIRAEKLDELADLVTHYEDRELTVVFATPDRWSDARNFKKLLDAD
jgi:uncharacterized protein YecE (DUF72 family)